MCVCVCVCVCVREGERVRERERELERVYDDAAKAKYDSSKHVQLKKVKELRPWS